MDYKNILDNINIKGGDWYTPRAYWSTSNKTTGISWSDLKKALATDQQDDGSSTGITMKNVRSLGYENLPHTESGTVTTRTTSTSGTDEQSVAVDTTYNNDSTKIAEKKYRLPNGEIRSILAKTTTVDSGSVTKTKSTTVKSKAKSNRDGITTSVSTSVKTSKTAIISSDEDYKKQDSGVVTNTSNSAYETARAAKRTRIAKEKAEKEMKNAVDVLKNEVPIDIFELKQLVKMIMDHLGIVPEGEARVVDYKNEEDLQTLAEQLVYPD